MVEITTTDGVTRLYRDIILDNPDDLFFCNILDRIGPDTMTGVRGVEPLYSLFKSIQYLVQNDIPGDFVECGVWRGGSITLMALSLLHFGDTSRKIYLYDTFLGMTQPEERDVNWDGNRSLTEWEKINSVEIADNETRVMGYGGSIEEVRERVFTTNYPKDKFVFVKGPVEETIPATVPEHIAMLRLDTDWYASTYHEFVHLYPLLGAGGVIIVDDYGWCRGAREATDQYIKENKLDLFLNRVDESVRIGIKRI